jgi:hypothetical protein
MDTKIIVLILVITILLISLFFIYRYYINSSSSIPTSTPVVPLSQNSNFIGNWKGNGGFVATIIQDPTTKNQIIITQLPVASNTFIVNQNMLDTKITATNTLGQVLTYDPTSNTLNLQGITFTKQ